VTVRMEHLTILSSITELAKRAPQVGIRGMPIDDQASGGPS